jgi:hypothetical protein
MKLKLMMLMLVALFALAPAYAGTPVDQGKPGTQGPWPVTLVSGSTTPTVATLAWTRIATFDLEAWFGSGNTLGTNQELAFSYNGTSTLTATLRTTGATGVPNAIGFELDSLPTTYREFRIVVSIVGTTGSGTLTANSRIYATRTVARNEPTAGVRALASTYTQRGNVSSYWVWTPQPYAALVETVIPITPFWSFYLSVAGDGSVNNIPKGTVELWGLR